MFRKTQNAASSTQFSALVKVLIITGFVLSTFCLTATGQGISKDVPYSSGFTNDVFPIPAGISLTIGVSSSASGTITITGPGGFSAVRSLSSLGSSSFDVTLGAAGTYTVNESYSLTVTGSNALLDPLPSVTDSASATPWTFTSSTPGATASFQVSSSFGSLAITSTSANISASVSGMSIIITTTALIDIGDSVSATAQGTWTVSMSVSVTEAVGTVAVTTNNASATFDLTGAATESGSGTSQTWTDMPTGSYTCTFGAVAGFITPAPQTKPLAAGGTITFDGVYTPIPGFGTVVVTTNNASATFSITGPSNVNGSGTSQTWTDMPTGSYTCTFGAVAGFNTPSPQTRILIPDGTITFDGVYTAIPQVGTIVVTTNNAGATFDVTGPSDVSGSGTSRTWTDMPPGSYTCTFNPIIGFNTPSPQTKPLAVGETITFDGVYTAIPQVGTIVVMTNNASATFDVTGPSDVSGSGTFQTWTDMPTGSYTCTFNSIAGFNTLAPQTKSLAAGGTITFDGQYTAVEPETGTVVVQTNLKDGVAFTVTSPDYTEADFSFEDFDTHRLWMLAGVPTGDHTITYGDVPGYSDPASETLTLIKDGVIKFVGEYIPISLKIDIVGIAGSPAGLGDTIIVIMTGDPGHEAVFSIGDLVINAPMPEEIAIESGPVLGTPGLYRGEYVVQEGDNIVDAVVSVKLTSVTGATAINEDGRVTIDTTPPVIDSVVVSGSPARNVGDIIMVTMKGEPGAIANLSIAGVTQTTMVESAEQPGIYEATYTAVEGLNVSGAAVVVSLTDALGNTSVDENQTVSICILPWDINKDGIVDVLDIQIVSSNIGKEATPELDLNGDGVIDTLDVLIVAIHFGETCGAEDGILAAAPSASHTVPDHLFQNYPNPSNPGTWIPFMLADGNETVVSIYSSNGQLVRRLDLGYKDPGVYVSKEQGVYWDGGNEYGEEVASGVYFYHIKAGNFSAVRKMLIAR